MNIIKSDIISTEYDAFWNDVSSPLKNAPPRPVLVLATAYEANSPEETQLLKIIDACKITPGQYNIVQIKEGEKIAWHRLREQLTPRVIFLFGILPVQLGISSLICLNEPNNFNDRIWLPTLSLGELDKHVDVKKQLWVNGITPIFIDKQFGEI